MLEYEEFLEYLKTNITTVLGKDEYEARLENKAENDKTIVEVLWFYGKSKASKGIRPRELYKDYKAGKSLGDICVDAIKELENRVAADNLQLELSEIGEFEKVKDKLIIRPLSWSNNKKTLESFVYRLVEDDIALVLYINFKPTIMGNSTVGYTSAKISRSQVEKWGLPQDEVWEFALANMQKAHPPLCLPISQTILLGANYAKKAKREEKFFMDKNFKYMRRDPVGTYVLGIHDNANGCIAVFYQGALEKLANFLEDDLYLVLTNTRNCILKVATSIDDKETLRELMKKEVEVMKKQNSKDLLSENLYFYEYATKKLILLKD